MQAKKQVVSAKADKAILSRELGRYGDEQAGPVLITIGGMHGNEQSGIFALDHIISELYHRRPKVTGMLLALRGNLSALSNNQRYIDVDFNRIWTPNRMRELNDQGHHASAFTVEEREQIELFQVIRDYLHRSERDVYLLDLHTTSASSAPFVIMSDTLRNRAFANAFPVPAILGMEEHFVGPLITHLDDLGLSSVAFEAGQHDDPASIDLQVAAIWIALTACGCLSPDDVPEYWRHFERLQSASSDLERVYEIRYRYEIQKAETFAMRPGFANFQDIATGQELATSEDHSVTAHIPGQIFMPLYQAQGNDGFFIIAPVKYFWLTISKWLRYSRLSALLPLFPGIRKNTPDGDELRVNRRICRWFTTEIFHLFGFRRKRYDPDSITFIKRRFDP